MDYSKEAYNIYKNRRGVDMNKVQQKKWISVLGMGVFILTMLYICTLYSDEDKRNVAKNAAVTDKMQRIFQKIYFLTVELVAGGRI